VFYQKTILDNGVTVISEAVSGVRSVSLGIWFKVGSRDETDEEQGISHFMEHMLFKGTGKRDAFQISQDFESIGAEQNAFTSKEYTCFFSRFVDDKLPRVFEILGDMITGSVFEQSAIDSEREVVIEEIARCEDTPDDYIFELFTRAIFPAHSLGRQIIGTREVVGSFVHDDCIRFCDAHYHAANCIVTASGNIEHDELVSLCREHLSGLPEGKCNERGFVDTQTRDSFAILKKETEQAHIIYGMPGISMGDEDRYAGALLDTALGGGMSSRLFQEVREKRGLAYAVYATTMPYCGAGQFLVYAGTRPTNIREVTSIIKHELEKMLKGGLSQEELDCAREYVIGHIVLSTESTSQRMLRLGRNAVSDIDLLSLDEVIEKYRKVTLADITQVAERVLSLKPSIAVISPLREKEVSKTLAEVLRTGGNQGS
jgi:predicted Zn-dependent peptidase